MSKAQETPARKRKPAARRSDIVIALLEDRLDMIAAGSANVDPAHILRMRDLLDELKRSINRNSPEPVEES